MNMTEKRTINYSNCLSIKNKRKNTIEQCNHKRLEGCEFCGIHKRSKNTIKVTQLHSVYDISGDIYKTIVNIDKINKANNDINYYSKKYLLTSEINFTNEKIKNCEFGNIDNIQVTKLRNTIKKYKLKNIICKKQSKRNIYRELLLYLRKEEKYEKNIDKIIKIQKIFRCYNIYRRNNSVNLVECNSFISIYDIPANYYYYLIENNKKYSFDFRSIYNIIDSDFKNNPYTMNKISEKTVNKIKKEAINRMVRFKQNWYFQKEEMTEDEKVREYALETFHKIDMLGNYTDFNWLLEMNILLLKRLYRETKDMFDFRINLSLEYKKKYVNNGIAFSKSINFVNNINNKNGVIRIILDEYNRFLNFSNNIEDKKTAILWLLSSLVELSYNARIALPHLDQNLFEVV